ncbi:MAG: tetratricopeptide repeat protein [Flavobacteriales bacterium]|nr:tetratricopeptide repeat protein [Flavobacteriales bacterium]
MGNRLLICLVVVFHISVKASNIDSLKLEYESASNDSVKAHLALKLCDKLGRNENAIAKAYAEEALTYYTKAKEPKGIGLALGHLGFVYYYNSEFDEAVNVYMQAIEIFDKHNLTVESADIRNKIGVLYNKLRNSDQALEYFKEVLLIYENGLEDKVGESYVLNNMGLAYERMKEYDKALAYYNMSLILKKENKDSLGIASPTNNIGNIYYFKQELKVAIQFWNKALKMKERLNDLPGMSNTTANIAQGYYELGNNDRAIQYANKALAIAHQANNKYYIQNALSLLADFNAAKKNYKEAYENHVKYVEVKDSIFTENSSRQMAEMETKYQTERKEKENELLKRENEIRLLKEEQEAEAAKLLAAMQQRRDNIQYSIIFIALLILFGSVTFLGYISVSERMAEGLIFFSFLIFFEFLLVVADPLIEEITLGAPGYKLLINAGIAALIFPAHAFFENTLKKRLTKNKKE